MELKDLTLPFIYELDYQLMLFLMLSLQTSLIDF